MGIKNKFDMKNETLNPTVGYMTSATITDKL